MRIARSTCLALTFSLFASASEAGSGALRPEELAGWWMTIARRVAPGKPTEETSAMSQNVVVLGGRYLKVTGTLPGGESGVPLIAYLGVTPDRTTVSLVWIDGSAPIPRVYTGPLPASGPLELRSPTPGGADRLKLDPGDGTSVTFRFERDDVPGHLEVVLEKR